ncbi:MAG: tetratricopeptide repeat protein [Lentimicrobiaceae bacterium]|nr:tetratricopeptide repeat protein [Lentimicrobiaceae bacterium]
MYKLLFLVGLLMCTCTVFPQGQSYTNEQLALQYMMNREFDKAVEIYEDLYNKNPTQYYFSNYTFCLIELQNYEKAEKIIKKHIRSHPKEPKFLVDLGYVYSKEGEQRKSENAYNEAIEKMKPDRQQITELANAFLVKRENERAIETIKKGRNLLPDKYPFSIELADIYERQEDWSNYYNELLDLIIFDYQYLQNVQNKLQDNLTNDPENKKNEAFRNILLKRIQKFPEQQFYAELMIWYSIQQKDFASALLQAKALDRRNGENGQRIMEIGDLATTNKKYELAEDAYSYIVTKKGEESPYYVNSRIALLETRMNRLIPDFPLNKEKMLALENEMYSTLSTLGKNRNTIPLMRALARLEAFYLSKNNTAIALLNEAINIENISTIIQAECKLDLADIMLFSGEQWEATLLYSQVEKSLPNDPLAHEAKFRNARLFYFIGEFSWAKAQLDVLKAATSKLIANDAMQLSLLIADNTNPDSTSTELAMYSRADFLLYQNKKEMALQTLDSLLTSFSSHPIISQVIFKESEIRILQGRYLDADTLLGQILVTYPYSILADDALMKRAELYENQFQNPTKAMYFYQKLMTNYPGSLFVEEARKRFRALRGDLVN